MQKMADFCDFSMYDGSLSWRATSKDILGGILANCPNRLTATRRIPHLLANQEFAPETPLERSRGLTKTKDGFAMAGTQDSKRCTKCGEEKPIELFGPSKMYKGGRRSQCNPCRSAHERQNRKPSSTWSPEKRARINYQRRDGEARRMYGITRAEAEAILAAQGGTCAICHAVYPGFAHAGFHIDHCHVTGKFRGILCYRCNIRLAIVEDHKFVLAGRRYLRKAAKNMGAPIGKIKRLAPVVRLNSTHDGEEE